MKERFDCLQCGGLMPETYEPNYCCDGRECGCYGMPTNPLLCSLLCWELWTSPPAKVLVRPCEHACPEWDYMRISARDYEFVMCLCPQYENNPLAIMHTNIHFISEYEGELHNYYPSGWDGLYTSLG